MANKVSIVTDSTAYIPQAWREKYGIRIAPAVVIWGDEELRDLFDITPTEFFTRLASAEVMPSTSQPSPAAVKEHYDAILAEGNDVLGIFISNKLSGTLASAIQAKSMLEGENIELVDTLSASMGAGWPIKMAADAAAAGKSLAECAAIAQDACNYTGVLLTVDTLEFLHRGGRIGGAQRFIGTALNFKPILEVQDGRIEALERVRTRKKALSRLVELAVERIGDRRPVYIAALHANAPDAAHEVLEMFKAQVETKETLVTDVSPAVGTHTGPGTVGLAFLAGYGD